MAVHKLCPGHLRTLYPRWVRLMVRPAWYPISDYRNTAACRNSARSLQLKGVWYCRQNLLMASASCLTADKVQAIRCPISALPTSLPLVWVFSQSLLCPTCFLQPICWSALHSEATCSFLTDQHVVGKSGSKLHVLADSIPTQVGIFGLFICGQES